MVNALIYCLGCSKDGTLKTIETLLFVFVHHSLLPFAHRIPSHKMDLNFEGYYLLHAMTAIST